MENMAFKIIVMSWEEYVVVDRVMVVICLEVWRTSMSIEGLVCFRVLCILKVEIDF